MDLMNALLKKNWKLAISLIVPRRYRTGIVYAVEFSPRSGRDLINMCKLRDNVVPIIEDARFSITLHFRTYTLIGTKFEFFL